MTPGGLSAGAVFLLVVFLLVVVFLLMAFPLVVLLTITLLRTVVLPASGPVVSRSAAAAAAAAAAVHSLRLDCRTRARPYTIGVALLLTCTLSPHCSCYHCRCCSLHRYPNAVPYSSHSILLRRLVLCPTTLPPPPGVRPCFHDTTLFIKGTHALVAIPQAVWHPTRREVLHAVFPSNVSQT